MHGSIVYTVSRKDYNRESCTIILHYKSCKIKVRKRAHCVRSYVACTRREGSAFDVKSKKNMVSHREDLLPGQRKGHKGFLFQPSSLAGGHVSQCIHSYSPIHTLDLFLSPLHPRTHTYNTNDLTLTGPGLIKLYMFQSQLSRVKPGINLLQNNRPSF